MKVTVLWADGYRHEFSADRLISERVQWRIDPGESSVLVPIPSSGVRFVRIDTGSEETS